MSTLSGTELINPTEIPRSVNNYLGLHHEKLSNRSGDKNGEYSRVGWHRFRNKRKVFRRSSAK